MLETHVRRMAADDRARALVENFAVQWLSLRQLRPVTLDAEIFTEYDGNLREAFLQETQLFVQDQLRQDRSVLDLLTAKYTFVNERLARHYGIPERVRQSLSTRRRRGRAGRAAWTRQHPDRDVVPDANFAGSARALAP